MPDYRVESVAEKASSWLKRNAGIVAVIGGLVVIIAAVLIYGEVRRQRDESEALRLYDNLPTTPENRMQVLTVLVNNFSGTSVGKRAKLDYAKELYQRRQIDQAEEMYDSVLNSQGDKSLYGARAKLGLAYCATQKQDYDRARKLFEEIRDQGAGEGVYAVYAGEAERMLKVLENPPAIPAPVEISSQPERIEPIEPFPGDPGIE